MNGTKNKVFRLKGKVQHYDWGGDSYIAHLLHIPNPEGKPFAEYWLGAHDQASGEIILDDGKKILLNEYIQASPSETLGQSASIQFGRLPYLLKLLDVKKMLSIQVHPTKKNAEIEFQLENKRGIPLQAAERNYKDDNHKPELMVALGEFWLLHGFKPRAEMISILRQVPELNFLIPVFEKGSYEILYRTVMEMDQAGINRVLEPLLGRIIPAYQKQELQKTSEDFWAARAALTFNQPGKIDRGIFSIYFFNLLHLREGEAIFQDAGLPHAYLEGRNVEIMANSDNVLRAGLTSKHIDLKELMKHVKFEPTHPERIAGQRISKQVTVYPTPAPDFELSRIRLDAGEDIRIKSPAAEIGIILEGAVELQEHPKNSFARMQAEAWVGFQGAEFNIRALEPSVIYKAGIPMGGRPDHIEPS